MAEQLTTVRRQAELTVRDVAAVMNYSHSHVARAATCQTLPRWELVACYLAACGITGPDLASWKRLWALTERQERAHRKGRSLAGDEVAPDDEWRSAVATVRKVVPLVILIRRIGTTAELGTALARLAECRGHDSLRKVEKKAGVPRATLHSWFLGKTKPSSARLDRLVVGLEATRPEQREFAQCLDRLTQFGGCDDMHPSTGQICVLARAHTGDHRTADGTTWLDDAEPRPRPTWGPTVSEDDQRKFDEWHDWYVEQLEPAESDKPTASSRPV